MQVIPDRAWVSFMYSYPNLIPLPEAAMRRIAATLGPYAFEHVLRRVVGHRDRARWRGIVQRSAARYIDALQGETAVKPRNRGNKSRHGRFWNS